MTAVPAAPSPVRGRVELLLAAAHGGPAVAVTLLAALLGVAADLGPGRVVGITLAVLAGQLTIGWGNDLLDADRDSAVGRSDKPLATGRLDPGLVRGCLAAAAVAAVALSLVLGWRAGSVHLLLLVGMGHAYNLGLKATAASWVPYAVAFGSLPAVVTLAAPGATWGDWAPWWQCVAGATLGVGAHLLNALPDLADDLATGVRGLPHRLGATGSRVLAALALLAASVATVAGPGGRSWAAWAALVVVVALLAVATTGRGRWPFRAAVLVALVDVVLLVTAR
ncbi:UbiA family prenyltransferase [Nocardioides litoris]|uniref:UbiA family prenyltransferase n=1 Tax=Nocardioides litoris TaxID=1926648 RepID=UPI001B87A3C0|nr:UbiA family prenyltransferase [Nocardioides litoris]